MPLSTFTIGALLWINNNPKTLVRSTFYKSVTRHLKANSASALTLEVHNLKLSPEEEFQSQFCNRTGLQPENIKNSVATTTLSARPKRCVDKHISLNEDQAPVTFSHTSQGWNFLSKTVSVGKVDELKRYNVGPTDGHLTCAVDVALFIGIQLNVGRIVRDVVTPNYLGGLPLPVRVFWWVVASPWGVMTQAQRNAARDVVVDTLATYSPTQFPRGQFQSVQAALDALLLHTPQVSWTEAATAVCCDGLIRSDDRTTWRVRVCSSVSIGGSASASDTIEQLIQAYFAQETTLLEEDSRCEKQGDCVRRPRRRSHTILDGAAPARLVVHLAESATITYSPDDTTFATIHLRFHSLRGDIATTYQVVGAVFVENNNHFVGRWRDATRPRPSLEVRCYNGGSCTAVPTWWTGYDTQRPAGLADAGTGATAEFAHTPRVITLIYECII